MKNFLALFLFIITRLSAQVPDKEGSLVKWMGLEEAMQKIVKEPKPIIVDFYTDWCGWCKTMMKSTYADPELSNYINTYFYPVKFNAEGKDTVEYLGQQYRPVSDKPRTTHPLAEKLLNGKLMYPTTLFLNGYDKDKKEFKLNMIAAGYLEKTKIEPLLIFSLENAWRNSSYDDFNTQFQQTFYDSTIEQRQKLVHWQKPAQSFDTTKVKTKKTLVLINTDWCITCKVMKKTSFTDSTLNKYITDKYYLVDFNAVIEDTIPFKGQLFVNQKNPQFPFHQLAIAFGKNSITFPTLVVLNENLEIIDAIPSYISPAFLNDIIHYYGEDFHKTKSWVDFVKDKKVN